MILFLENHKCKQIHFSFKCEYKYSVVFGITFTCIFAGAGGCWPHLQHLDIPRPGNQTCAMAVTVLDPFFFFKGRTCGIWKFLGIKLEMELEAYTTATAKSDPSHVCDLHHSSLQCWLLNPLDCGQGLNPHPQVHYH